MLPRHSPSRCPQQPWDRRPPTTRFSPAFQPLKHLQHSDGNIRRILVTHSSSSSSTVSTAGGNYQLSRRVVTQACRKHTVERIHSCPLPPIEGSIEQIA